MTTTINSDEQSSISLEEYIDFCHGTKNLADPEVTIAAAPMLRRLSNNSSFLPDFLASQLKKIDQYNLKTDFTPPSF